MVARAGSGGSLGATITVGMERMASKGQQEGGRDPTLSEDAGSVTSRDRVQSLD